MIAIETLNAQFARLSMGLEIRRHPGGMGLFYVVSHRDGVERTLNSAMGLAWVVEWAAETMRDYFRNFVKPQLPYYPGTNAQPILNWTGGAL